MYTQCVWRLWVVSFPGIFKQPVCTITIKHGLFFYRFTQIFLPESKHSGRRVPPSERSALYIILVLVQLATRKGRSGLSACRQV